MQQILFLFCLTVSGIANADSETEEVILKRLEATEKLMWNLFDEVESLKAQDKLRIELISDLKKQLQLQQQRNFHLERLNRRLTVNKLNTEPKVDENTLVNSKQLNDIKYKLGRLKNRIKRVGNETPVAFFAKMDKHLEHAGVHQNFVFETVVTNIGNGYNSRLGSFVAPVSGTYLFSTTLFSFYHVSGLAQFVKNGQPVTVMYVSGDESGHDTTSQTIILQLQTGDEVAVQNVELNKSFYGGSHSIFSGFLLFKTSQYM